jgi:hypothetical protein
VTDASALNPLTHPGDFFVRYVPENLERFPGLDEAVKAFHAGERPAARAAEAWLKAIDLSRPPESATRLYFVDGLLRGFYSLANGQVTIASRRRERLGLARKVQPAVILTWIAKSGVHPCDGAAMVEDAVFRREPRPRCPRRPSWPWTRSTPRRPTCGDATTASSTRSRPARPTTSSRA